MLMAAGSGYRGIKGIYWQSWGPGWYCSDGTWLRTYNSASIWANTGTIATNGSFSGGYAGTAGPAGGAIFGQCGHWTTSPSYPLTLNNASGAASAMIHGANNIYLSHGDGALIRENLE